MESRECDLLIIGAGPTGLYGAYYAGFRGFSTVVLDTLPEVGGFVHQRQVLGECAPHQQERERPHPRPQRDGGPDHQAGLYIQREHGERGGAEPVPIGLRGENGGGESR